MNDAQNQSTNPVYDFVARRKLQLAAAAVAAALGGVVIGTQLATPTYICSGTMLYNRSNAGAPHYQQPEVQSIVGLVKSQPVLAAAAVELNLDIPTAALAASLQVEAQFGSNTIQFTMRGGDAETTRRTLDAVMRQTAIQAGNLRRVAMEQIIASQEAHSRRAQATAEAAAAALAEFNASHKIVVGVAEDLAAVHDDISTVETALETYRPERIDPAATLERRRALLQEQQDSERERIARSAELALKKNEYERAVRLHAKNYISDAEFRRIRTEYDALEAQVAAPFARRDARLEEVNAALATRLEPRDPASASDAVNSLRSGDASDEEVERRVREFLSQRRAEADRLNGLRAESDRLAAALTAARTEVTRVAGMIAGYQEVRDSQYQELAVVEPAGPALNPVSSNKKKLIASSGVGIWLGLVLPLLLWDLAAKRWRCGGAAGPASRLPQIASSDDADNAVRTLALRIQQSAGPTGSIALFADTSIDETSRRRTANLVAETAICLTRRGEAVLVFETSPSPSGGPWLQSEFQPAPTIELPAAVEADWQGRTGELPAPPGKSVAPAATRGGLAELLRDPTRSPTDAVRRGTTFDLLSVGEVALPAEAFAARRLSELFASLRDRYSTILVLGPNVEHDVDLEMLAARSTSVVFVAVKDGVPSSRAVQTIESMQRASAPILGLATV